MVKYGRFLAILFWKNSFSVDAMLGGEKLFLEELNPQMTTTSLLNVYGNSHFFLLV